MIKDSDKSRVSRSSQAAAAKLSHDAAHSQAFLGTDALRRLSDRDPEATHSLNTTATYLLERQAALDRTLTGEADASLATILQSTPPSPAALLMLQEPAVRERYAKLLHNAHIEVDVALHRNDALAKLSDRVHAVLFTDQVEVIRAARHLSVGAATHMVFVAADETTEATDALGAGANDIMPDQARGPQFWTHLTNIRRIVSFAASLQSAVTDNRILSTIDPLTRCGNRNFFEQQFPREVTRAIQLGRPLALVLGDVDLFKHINDQHGHQVGDEVLQQFGERLTRGLRMGEDWVARIGGEEFAIVLPETGRLQGRAIAERLCERIGAEPFQTSVGPVAVTASFGVCGMQRWGKANQQVAERLVRAADAALYASKRAGRNRITENVVTEES